MRVILADDVADRAGGLVVGTLRREVQLVHGVKNAPVHGLQPVADIGKRAAHDHAHRVIEVGALHFIQNGYGFNVGGAFRPRPVVAGVAQWKSLGILGFV